MKSKYLTFILLCLSSSLTYGYDVETHKLITQNAVQASNLPVRLPDLGFTDLKDTVSNNTYEFGGAVWCLTGFSRQLSILDVIKQGAFCEDATGGTQQAMRYLNHFYDPAHGGAGFLGNTFPSSLAWGLEAADFGSQDYSFKDARNYFYQGLTLPAKADRDNNFSLTFRTLGHVMHLVQDMAQPQHTRDDSHASRSLYEKYTDRIYIRNSLPYGGYSPVQITSPDQLWSTTGGKGLADYSNRGFVSAGTNFRGSSNNILPATNYLLPNGTGATVDRRQITDPDLLGPVGPNQPLIGEIRFIKTPVQDNYTGTPDTNSRTSTFSLFDDDLSAMGGGMVFSLNRFNFTEAHKLLIPRAVGYSAGLINYFFRGKLDVTQDPNLPGFFAIQNMGAENMSGTFSLYYDDVSGARNPVSTAVWPLNIPANGQSGPLTFTPPSAAKSTDKYMLVFKGDMGQEAQTAVAAKAATLTTLTTCPSAGGNLIFTNGGKRTVASVTHNSGTAYDAAARANEMYSVEGTAPFKIAKRVIGGVVSQDPANWLYLSGSAPASIKLATDNGTVPIIYTGNRGDDKAAFTLTADTLTFNATPDFEASADADANNNYETCIMALDKKSATGFENIAATVRYFYNVTRISHKTAYAMFVSRPYPNNGMVYIPGSMFSFPDEQSADIHTRLEELALIPMYMPLSVYSAEDTHQCTGYWSYLTATHFPSDQVIAGRYVGNKSYFDFNDRQCKLQQNYIWSDYWGWPNGWNFITPWYQSKQNDTSIQLTQITNAENGQQYNKTISTDGNTKTETYTIITTEKIWPLTHTY